MPREDIQLLQIRIAEGEDLGQECVEAQVVRELAGEVVLLVGRMVAVSRDDRLERRRCRGCRPRWPRGS
jgi:hypothetical protein